MQNRTNTAGTTNSANQKDEVHCMKCGSYMGMIPKGHHADFRCHRCKADYHVDNRGPEPLMERLAKKDQ